jgi:hypothetical protein
MKSEECLKRSATFLSANPDEIDTYAADEIKINNHIHQTLASTLNDVYLDRLKSREKSAMAPRIQDAITRLIENNQSLMDFVQNLYNSISERIEMTPEEKKSFITAHIQTVARQFPSKTSVSELLEAPEFGSASPSRILLKDFQSILSIPSTDIFNPSAATVDPSDRRVYYVEERKQRRYDSLARLLSMSSQLSACTAVTMLDGELIIAANCSSTANSADIIRALTNKLHLVRQALKTPGADVIERTIQQLKLEGGLFQPEFILSQALSKLTQSTANFGAPPSITHTTDNFSTAEINTLMGNEHASVTFLIPHQLITEDGEEHYGIAIHAMHETSPIVHPFAQQYPSQDIQYFHAEQLLAYYLQEIKKTQLQAITEEYPPINIGLGKLCCSTCSVLTHFKRLHLRGSSGISFTNTINLFSNTYQPSVLETGSPDRPKKHKTTAEPSPIISPPEKQTQPARSVISRTEGIAFSAASMFAGSSIRRSPLIASMSTATSTLSSASKFNHG